MESNEDNSSDSVASSDGSTASLDSTSLERMDLSDASSSGSSFSIPIWVIVIVGLLIVGVFWWYTSSKSSDSNSTPNPPPSPSPTPTPKPDPTPTPTPKPGPGPGPGPGPSPNPNPKPGPTPAPPPAVRNCIPGAPIESNWTECPPCLPVGSSTTPSQYQFVQPMQQAENGGTQCSFEQLLAVRACADLPPCQLPPSCKPAQEYTTPCNVECGGGIQVVVKPVLDPVTQCTTDVVVTQQTCNTQSCGTPDEHCESVSNWPTTWSECDMACGPGVQYQTRQPLSSTDPCPLIREQACNLGDCVQTQPQMQSLFPSRMATFDSSRRFIRASTNCVPPTRDQLATYCYERCIDSSLPSPTTGPWTMNGVTYCGVTSDAMQNVCNLDTSTCPVPQDCQLSDWSTPSACSLSACDYDQPDGGLSTSVRTIVSDATGGGKACSEFVLVNSIPCNNLTPQTDSLGNTIAPQCHPVDCVLSPTKTTLPCNAQCGGGTQISYTSIETPASGGGKPCPTDPSAYITISTCNTQPCGDCVFEPWSTYFAREGDDAWGPCDLATGLQTAGPRNMVTPAQPGGSCDTSQAFTTQQCCQDGNCILCPVGCGNLICSGQGTCTVTSTTNPDGTISKVGTCDCLPGFYGASCDAQAPLGNNGEQCSGWGQWDEKTLECVCPSGISGTYCSKLETTDWYAMLRFTDLNILYSDGITWGVSLGFPESPIPPGGWTYSGGQDLIAPMSIPLSNTGFTLMDCARLQGLEWASWVPSNTGNAEYPFAYVRGVIKVDIYEGSTVMTWPSKPGTLSVNTIGDIFSAFISNVPVRIQGLGSLKDAFPTLWAAKPYITDVNAYGGDMDFFVNNVNGSNLPKTYMSELITKTPSTWSFYVPSD